MRSGGHGVEHCGPDGRDDRQCMRKVKTYEREGKKERKRVVLICFSMLDLID